EFAKRAKEKRLLPRPVLAPGPAACGQPGKALQLAPPVQFVNEGARVAPAGLDFYEEFQEDLCSQHLLDFKPCARADFLQHLAAFAYENRFLAVAFAKDRGGDAGELLSLFELFY